MTIEFMLPWERAMANPEAGFLVPTTLAVSSLPGAGIGRFALEDIPVGTIIRQFHWADVRSCLSDDSEALLVFRSEKDLDFVLNQYVERSTHKASVILDKMINFLFSDFGLDAACVYLYNQSGYLNHSSVASTVMCAKDSVEKAIEPIHQGEEIYWNYLKKRPFPDFYHAWCLKHNALTLHEKMQGFY